MKYPENKKKNISKYDFIIAIVIFIGGIVTLVIEKNNQHLETILEIILILQFATLIILVLYIKRKANKKIKNQIDLLEIFMEHTPDVVYFKDLDSKIIKISKAIKNKSISYPIEDMIGKTDFDIFGFEHANKAFMDEQEIIKTKQPKLKMLEKEIHKDGNSSWALTSKFPLLNEKGKVIGTFGISRDITLEKIAVEKLELARENEHQYVIELEKRSKDNNYLNEMNDNLQTINSMKEAYFAIIEFASRIFKNEIGGLYIIDNQTDELSLVSSWGMPKKMKDLNFPSKECAALKNGITNFFHENHSGLRCGHVNINQTDKSLCIPIIAPGETFGVFYIQPKEKNLEKWPEDYKDQFLKNFTFSAGLALANIKLRENLREQSIRDPLTGLFNRRYMVETLQRECSRISRRNSTLGIIMLDIDHFKKVNDTYGHDAGDFILQSISSIFTKMIRNEDIACRFGGEEFILILPEVNKTVLFNRAEEIRKEIEQAEFVFNQKDLGKITISGGIYIYQNYDESVDKIIENVDGALYKAKRNGRNQIKIA